MSLWHFLTRYRCPACLRAVGHKSIETLELLKEKEAYFKERYDLILKRETLLDKEKEAILGKDGAEIKRSILLKTMQGKWEAERKQLDADRVYIMLNTKEVGFSLRQRLEEITVIMSNIKKKERNVINEKMLNEYGGKFEELDSILRIIDAHRNES